MTDAGRPSMPRGPTAAERELFARAQDALLADDLAAARESLQALLAAHRGDAQLSTMLAGVLLGQGQLRAATACLLDTLPAMLPVPEVIARVARYLHEVGESRGTRDCLDRAVPDHPRAAAGLAAMGMMWQTLGLPGRALDMLDRASRLGFDAGTHHYYRGLQLQFLGRSEEACEAWRRGLQLDPAQGRACLSWVRSAKSPDQAALLAVIDKGMAVVQRGGVDHAAFEFARFHLHDNAGRLDDAWAALERGNAVMAARVQHDPAEMERLIDATIAACDAASLAPVEAPHDDGPQPIFIVGMPRSGTTLLERVLGNHSRVVPVGELNDFWRQMRWMADLHGQRMLDEELLARVRDIDFAALGGRYLAQARWRAGDTPHFIDKLPSNVHLAGLIHKAFPRAPILHLVRDPMDVCYSNYKAMFGESFTYSYDQDHLGAYYRQYQRLMRHWHAVVPGAILDVPYAQLVQDPEATVRKVLEFCRLPFEPACLDIRSNTAPVTTLSTAQVREGIHARALGEWRRYEDRLEPLRRSLDHAQ